MILDGRCHQLDQLDQLTEAARVTPSLTRLFAKREGIDPLKLSTSVEGQLKKLKVQ